MSSPEEISRSMSGQPQPPEAAWDEDLKRREETKREAATGPATRWQAAQQFMAWAAAQSTAPVMSPAACKAKERRLLAGMAEMFEKKAVEE